MNPSQLSAQTPSANTEWKKPVVREIPCGYEINAYASAERRSKA